MQSRHHRDGRTRFSCHNSNEAISHWLGDTLYRPGAIPYSPGAIARSLELFPISLELFVATETQFQHITWSTQLALALAMAVTLAMALAMTLTIGKVMIQ